jgi:hypothetical protein
VTRNLFYTLYLRINLVLKAFRDYVPEQYQPVICRNRTTFCFGEARKQIIVVNQPHSAICLLQIIQKSSGKVVTDFGGWRGRILLQF